MRYFLDTYTGTGTDTDPCRPSTVDPSDRWSSIDLRPPGAVEGVCLVAADTLGPQTLDLGDDLDVLTPGSRRALSNRLGLNLHDRRLRRCVTRLLAVHGEDRNPRRWNRLRPEADGRFRVWLGGLIDTRRLVFGDGGVLLQDSFTRANNADLSVGAPFSWTDVTGDFGITSNLARNVTNNIVRSRAESDLAGPDHYCQSNVLLGTSALSDGGVCARYSSAADTCYMARRTRDVGGTSRITKVIAGTSTILATGTCAAGGDFVGVLTRLACSGSTISATFAGVDLLTVTDTSIPSGLRTGIGSIVAGGAGRVIHGSFEAADLSPSSTGFLEMF